MNPPRKLRSQIIPPTLSGRETQVLVALMQGKTNREIATQLAVAESTVKAHVTSILMKFGVSTRLEAAVVAWETFPMLRVLRQPHLHIVRDTR